jgi:glycosyltransferase involved in cell wall biosynthesis
MDKGFHLLPEAARLCLQKGLDVAFAVQVQHTGWERETVAAEALLRKLPNVHLIEGTLSSEAYCEEIGEIDIMLLPYHPERFGMRGSGVFTESVAAGRPIIAAEGIFAAKAIADGEAEGEIFAPYEATALAAAIERLLPRLSACRLRAAERATLFARSHSADAYVDIVLAHARDLGT